MADFKVIETQEDLDKIIQKRLAQKDREIEEQFKDYLSPEKAKDLRAEYEKRLDEVNDLLNVANAKISDHDRVVSDLKKELADTKLSLTKNRIAVEKGLPYKFAERLLGTTDEDISRDADLIKEMISEHSKQSLPAPLHTSEVKSSHAPAQTNTNAALLGMLSQINEQMQTN